MEYERFGRTDMEVSKIGIGTWQFGEKLWGYGESYTDEDLIRAIERGLALGINFIDTAEVYGGGLSEEIVRKAIKRAEKKPYIFTKVSGRHLRYDDVLKACEGSLKRLQIETIDLYQIHWPSAYVPLEETLRAMEKLVDEGKVRFIGLSNFSLPLLKEAERVLGKYVIVSNQMKYNLIERDIERDLLPYMLEKNIALLAYSPLAMGLLTGKYREGSYPEDPLRKDNPLFTNPENLEQIGRFIGLLQKVGEKYGATPAQVALNWVASKGGVFAIVGVKNSRHVESNAEAISFKFDEEDIKLLEEESRKLKLSYF